MDEDWVKLGRAIQARRKELGLLQEDIPRREGPSVATIRKLESGTEPSNRPRTSTFYQVDAALQWLPGTAQSVLGGADPALSRIPAKEPARSLASASVDDLVTRLREIADELARRA